MIILITGTPGAGKTLRAIELLMEYLKDGREVFANIAGLSVDGILPAPDDWREAPDGAVVCFDEAQELFPADGKKGRLERPDVAEMEKHRHRGIDLVLITQHPGLIHSHVRRLVGRHIHLFRLYGSHQVKMFTQERCMAVDNLAELRAADEQVWSHPKKLYTKYKSATVHTHKVRLPRKVVASVAAMFVLAGFVWYLASQSSFFAAGAEASEPARDESPAQALAPASDAPFYLGTPVEAEAPGEIGGCVSTDTHCRCYDRDLVPITMQDWLCREIISKPLPRRLPHGGSSGASRRSVPLSKPPESSTLPPSLRR